MRNLKEAEGLEKDLTAIVEEFVAAAVPKLCISGFIDLVVMRY